jgi:hypothetical protein
LGLIPALKISDFNLGDRNNYEILAPHRYLLKTIGNKPKIVPQSWIKELTRSMILNMMKIPHSTDIRRLTLALNSSCRDTTEGICGLIGA